MIKRQGGQDEKGPTELLKPGMVCCSLFRSLSLIMSVGAHIYMARLCQSVYIPSQNDHSSDSPCRLPLLVYPPRWLVASWTGQSLPAPHIHPKSRDGRQRATSCRPDIVLPRPKRTTVSRRTVPERMIDSVRLAHTALRTRPVVVLYRGDCCCLFRSCFCLVRQLFVVVVVVGCLLSGMVLFGTADSPCRSWTVTFSIHMPMSDQIQAIEMEMVQTGFDWWVRNRL